MLWREIDKKAAAIHFDATKPRKRELGEGIVSANHLALVDWVRRAVGRAVSSDVGGLKFKSLTIGNVFISFSVKCQENISDFDLLPKICFGHLNNR